MHSSLSEMACHTTLKKWVLHLVTPRKFSVRTTTAVAKVSCIVNTRRIIPAFHCLNNNNNNYYNRPTKEIYQGNKRLIMNRTMFYVTQPKLVDNFIPAAEVKERGDKQLMNDTIPEPEQEQEQEQEDLAENFLYAAHLGNLDLITECIKKGVHKETKDEYGSTALHLASSYNNLEIVQYLIDICQVNTERKDNDGRTALHLAIENGHLEIVQYLIDTCHVNKEAKDNDERTALHYASFYGYLEIVQYLIDTCHVDTEATNIDGWTALHLASSCGHLEIVQYLIDTCHVNKEAKSTYGKTALHYASKNGNLEIVQYLIDTCHVNTEAKDNEGWTALHYASLNGYLEIIQFLIQECGFDIEVKTNAGEMAYDLAQKRDIIEYFDRARANRQAPATESNAQQSINNANEIQDDGTFEAGQLSTKTPFNDGVLRAAAQFSVQLEGAQFPLTDPENNNGTDRINCFSNHQQPALNQYELNEKWILDLMVSLQVENQQLVDMLNQMGSSIHFFDERRDIIDLIVVEKCNTIDEQEEQSAILASPLHRDFYLLLQRKLKCMIKTCEGLSTGMVGIGGGDLRSFTARTIREKGCNVLQETKLGFFIGNAVQWAKKKLAVVPFIDTVGSVFQLVVTLKDERERYVGLARVADFATMVCLQQYGTTSLDMAVEKFARWIVRARCGSPSCKFIEEKDEFGTFKQLMVNMLADSGNRPAKDQASKAADCAIAHIMKPDKDSILFDVLYGDGFDISLDEALAATILGISLEDLKTIDPITATSTTAILPSSDSAIPVTCENMVQTDPSNLLLHGTPVSSRASTLHGANHASSDIVAEQEAKIQKQDKIIEQLSRQVARLEEESRQSNSRVNNDAGDGLMYANPAEQFKNEITGTHTENATLDRRLCEHAAIIDELRSQMQDLQKELQKQRR